MPKRNMNGDAWMESIILCGGEAKRMKPYLPFNKALAEIKPDKTLLEHQVEWLSKSGMTQVVLAIDRENHKNLKEKELPLLDGIKCFIEEKGLGTGGAVFKAMEYVASSSFYVMNVDDVIISTTYAPSNLLEALQANQGALGLILLARARFPFGIVESLSDRVVGFRQKPLLDFKVCSGHYAFTKDGVRNYFPRKGNFEDEALQMMAQDNALYSKELEGEWLTINNIKQLEAARQRLIKNHHLFY